MAFMPHNKAIRQRIIFSLSLRIQRFHLGRMLLSYFFRYRYSSWLRKYERLDKDDRAHIQKCVKTGRIPETAIAVLFVKDTLGEASRIAQNIRQQCVKVSCIVLLLPEDLTEDEINRVVTAFADVKPVYLILKEGDLDALEIKNETFIFLEASVILHEQAVAVFALEMAKHKAQFVYCDEDIFMKGKRRDPFFKPEYSPVLLENDDYLGSCGLIKTDKVSVLALFKKLRLMQSVSSFLSFFVKTVPPKAIAHAPFVLFSENKRIKKHLIPKVSSDDDTEQIQTVSIIIPTRNNVEVLKTCIESILQKTDFERSLYEIIVVDNGSDESNALGYIVGGEEKKLFRVIRDNREFNYSRLNNEAADTSTADVLVFLNNDTEIIQSDWLQRLVRQAMQPDTGAVGAKLLYPDRTVQHAGVLMGIIGGAIHAFVYLDENDKGYHGFTIMDREVSAVTGACLAMRRQVFEEIGQFDVNLPVTFNDVLLCISAMNKGYTNVVLNTVKLIHYESKSRGYDTTPEKIRLNQKAWDYAKEKGKVYFEEDKYYSPNLSTSVPYQLAFPPRRKKLWFSDGKL